MKHILKILDISGADIAKHAGISRQAVNQGTPRADNSARILIEAARMSPTQMARIYDAYVELASFLSGQ